MRIRILLFSKEADDLGTARRKTLESNSQGRRVERYPTAPDLVKKLREPSVEAKIVILLIDNLEDLKLFVANQSLFMDVPLLIQVPDDSGETLRLAHLLRPRFLNGAQGDFSTLVEVLAKMVNHPREKPGTGA